jgi:hypothetical protein
MMDCIMWLLRILNKYFLNPSHNELFRIVINASHITIRRRGFSGHWGRQKVRKYLLEKHGLDLKHKHGVCMLHLYTSISSWKINRKGGLTTL